MINLIEMIVKGDSSYYLYRHGAMVRVRRLVNGARIEADKFYPSVAWAKVSVDKSGGCLW